MVVTDHHVESSDPACTEVCGWLPLTDTLVSLQLPDDRVTAVVRDNKEAAYSLEE